MNFKIKSRNKRDIHSIFPLNSDYNVFIYSLLACSYFFLIQLEADIIIKTNTLMISLHCSPWVLSVLLNISSQKHVWSMRENPPSKLWYCLVYECRQAYIANILNEKAVEDQCPEDRVLTSHSYCREREAADSRELAGARVHTHYQHVGGKASIRLSLGLLPGP